MRIKALKNFSGMVCMSMGEVRDVRDDIANDLIGAEYAEAVERDPAKAPDPDPPADPPVAPDSDPNKAPESEPNSAPETSKAKTPKK